MTVRPFQILPRAAWCVPALALFLGAAAPPPVPALTWSASEQGQYTHSFAVQAATTYTESGIGGWRLPTVAELQAALQNGTFGTITPNATWYFWASNTQGAKKAYAVLVASDANGQPIPAQSGTAAVLQKTSFLFAKFVR
ncbi:MAG: hypothetical protein U1E73_13725 [Planctomycetota bacterium]